MKKHLTLSVLIFASIAVFGQQEAQFSQNMFNIMGFNPAYAGSNDAICATLLIRQQWVGFKDTQKDPVTGAETTYKTWPQTNLFTADAPVQFLHGGAGITIVQDQLGFEKNLGLKLSYAYKRAIKTASLSAGLSVCFLNKKTDFTKFVYNDKTDIILSGAQKNGNMGVDIAGGLFYKQPGKYYGGISVSQAIGSRIILTTVDYKNKQHLYFTGGYYWPVPGSTSLELDPSFLFKTDIATGQLDINCLLKYNNQFWGGVSFRTHDAIALLVGLNWKSFHFGYAYDMTTSAMGKDGRSSGSHELLLGYCFKIVHEFKPESYRNPRFL